MGVFFILILVVLIVLFKLRVGIILKIDLIENVGYVRVDLFGFRVVYKCFNPIKSNGVFARQNGNKLLKNLLSNGLLKRLWITDISVEANVGVKDNALLTAICSSTINTAISRFLTLADNNKNTFVNKNVYTIFSKNALDFSVKGIIGVSFADIIISLIPKKQRRLYDN